MWGQNCTRLFGVKKTLNRLSGIVCEISAINKHNIKVQHINLTNKQSTVKHPSHFCFVEYECTSVKVHHVIIVIICNTSIVREDTIFLSINSSSMAGISQQYSPKHVTGNKDKMTMGYLPHTGLTSVQ